jgi:hypothetical protein
MKARVFYSADKEYLEVYDTPIVQGKAMMAAFLLIFDAKEDLSQGATMKR